MSALRTKALPEYCWPFRPLISVSYSLRFLTLNSVAQVVLYCPLRFWGCIDIKRKKIDTLVFIKILDMYQFIFLCKAVKKTPCLRTLSRL